MISELFHWIDPRYGKRIHVDAAYTPALNDVPVVYFNLFERDDLDMLQIMHGRQIKLVAMWDWFDEVWDKVHDRRQNYTMQDCFDNILSTRGELGQVATRMDHYAVTRRKKAALEAYERRNDPPIFFTGPPKEFLF